MLLAKDFYRAPAGTGSDLLPRLQWERYARQVLAMQRMLVAGLPDHADALAAMVDSAIVGRTAGLRATVPSLPGRADPFNSEEPVMAPDTTLACAIGG